MTETQRAYEQTDYEVVPVGNGNYEVPASTPATFSLSSPIRLAAVEDIFDTDRFALIDTYTERGDDEQFYWSSKVLVCETNQFCHVKLWPSSLNVFPKDEEFSHATLAAVVEQANSVLDTTLTFERREGTDT